MSQIVCSKCGRSMDEKQFYTHKDGTKMDMCKKCLTMHIDNFDPETFLWILEKVDVPYVAGEWNSLRDKAFAKDPYKMNGMSVIGKYLSKMKLKQWKDYGWADSEAIQAKIDERNQVTEKNNEAMAEELKRQLEQGMISQAEYKTRTSVDVQAQDLYSQPTPAQSEGPNFYNENNFMKEEELVDPGADLTADDKIYLAMKWGRLYKPSEWVTLEKKFKEMQNAFGIKDPDTLNSLIHLCKTDLKMNQAIDCGDIDGYLKMSRVYDSLRKTMKLTAAQKKEKESDAIDAVGILVEICERHDEEIPRMEITTPRDIVDKVIMDLKNFNRDLIYEDKALARQIEDYIKKKETAEQMKKDKEEAKKKGQDFVEITDEDHKKYKEMLEDDKNADKRLLEGDK